MIHIVLFEPEIAPNTGNIIRLVANTGFTLHLIEPLGFTLDDRRLRRAGLDYREWVNLAVHPNLETFMARVKIHRLIAVSTKGDQAYHLFEYQQSDAVILGPETRGLPRNIIDQAHCCLRIPMIPESRSLNLSNAAAVICYEAWRQHSFLGALL